MAISKCLLRVKYHRNHYLAVGLCFTGISCAIVQDVWVSKEKEKLPFTFRAFAGDLCVLGSAGLYALSNVLTEYLMVEGTPLPAYLALLGFHGFYITLIEGVIMNEEMVFVGKPFLPLFLLYAGFCLVNLLDYTIIPIYVKKSGATLLNLSNRTTILWSMIIDITLFGKSFHWLYLIAFIFEIAAVWLYSTRSPKYPVSKRHSSRSSTEYRSMRNLLNKNDSVDEIEEESL